MIISTLSLPPALDGGWVVKATPRPFYCREWPGNLVNKTNRCTEYQPVYKRAVYRTLVQRLVCRHDIDHVINDEHNSTIIVVLAKHEIVPWWWLLEPKHVGAIVGILIVFNISMTASVV